jgi:hypothetical protein
MTPVIPKVKQECDQLFSGPLEVVVSVIGTGEVKGIHIRSDAKNVELGECLLKVIKNNATFPQTKVGRYNIPYEFQL